MVASALTCENRDSQARAVVLEASLPEGWKALGDEDRFTLPPSGTDVRIVSFLVPADARAGAYEILYRLRDVQAGEQPAEPPAESTLAVTVLPEVDVALMVLEQPSFVLAGDDYEVSFLLTNAGNADTRIDLSVQSGQSFPFTAADPAGLSDVALPAGGAVQPRFMVRTPGRISQSLRNPLRVTVSPHGSAGAPPLAVATSVVETVPVGMSSVSMVNTMPLTSETMGSATLSSTPSIDLQETVKAVGSLDEYHQSLIELLARKRVGTDADPFSNPADQYSFRYTNPLLDIRLGDHSFGVSPLVLTDKSARGAQAGVTLAPVGVSAFLFDDFRSTTPSGGLGATLQFAAPASWSAADDLYRASLGVLSPLTDHALLDLWQRYAPWEHVQFQLDTALDLRGSAGPSPAVLAEARGEGGILTWDAQFIRAWPDFNGAYHDTQSISAGAGVRLLDDLLRLQASISLTDYNLLLDPSQPSAEESLWASVGASANAPAWGTRAILQWTLVRRQDRLPSPGFRTLENRANLSVRQPLRRFDLGVDSTLSAVHDELLGTTQWYQRHELSAGCDPSAAWRVLGALSYSERWIDEQAPVHAVGVSLGTRYGVPRTQAELGLRNEWSFSTGGLGDVSLGFDGRFVHLFPWEHSITLTTGFWLSWSQAVLTPSGSLSVAYSVPIYVPVSRRRDAVAVRGTVVRKETGAPMPGVVLRLNGLASVTDSRGEFDLVLPKSGTHYLQFDPRSLASGLIPDEDMPYEIDSPPGSEARIRLSVVGGCTVSGSVADYGFPASAAFDGGEDSGPEGARLERRAGLGGIVVQLSNGHESKRRVTGPDGRFVFDEVRPGAWTLALISGQLPSYHVVEKPTMEVALAPGETRDAEFRVIQQQRRIRMVDLAEGVVVQPAQEPVSGQVIRPEALEQTPQDEHAGEPESVVPQLDTDRGTAPIVSADLGPTPEPVPEPEAVEAIPEAGARAPEVVAPVAALRQPLASEPAANAPVPAANAPVPAARAPVPARDTFIIPGPAPTPRPFVPGPAPDPGPLPRQGGFTIPSPRKPAP